MMTRADPIAVIGMAGRFPKARTVDAFWGLLRGGIEVIERVADVMIDSRRDSQGQVPSEYVPMGTYLEDTEYFDCGLFGVTQREAMIMDPQQRLFIEQAWAAAEDAGYDISKLGDRVAVYAGAGPSRHPLDALEAFGHDSATMFEVIATGIDKPMAMRASHLFNLRGESIYIYAACATSLVAIDIAVNALRSDRCDAAVVGSSVLYLPQMEGYDYAEGGVRSSDGHCRAFDARADGTVWGSGVAVVVLKRMSDALRDRDRIRALVIGSAVNNDGSAKVNFAAPSRDGQADVIRTAMQRANVQPQDIDYVEAHGTGTLVGDPIEVDSLNSVFGLARGAKSCVLGSVKTNIGHLDPAAGIAGMLKAILAMEHEAIPPTLHLSRPNPAIDFGAGPFAVNAELKEWRRSSRVRRAGVNSFGVGGTNAHVIVEEAPQPPARIETSRTAHLVTLSAKTGSALLRMSDELAAHIAERPELELRDIAFTRNAGRRMFDTRVAFTARNLTELRDRLTSSDCKPHVRKSPPKLAFVFPGQGSQAIDMAADIYACEPLYRDTFDECAEVIRSLADLDIHRLVFPDVGTEADAAASLRQTDVQQPILFAVSFGLARLFQSWGIDAATMIGHSVGEFVAATLCGAMTPATALRLLVERGRALQSCPAGAMTACAVAASALREYLPTGVDIAAINAPQSCVAAGPIDSLVRLEMALKERGVRHARLATSHAFHSHQVEPAVPRFAATLNRETLNHPSRTWISTVTGREIDAAQATDPAFWTGQIVSPVLFADAVQTALSSGVTCFLELGGRPVLGSLILEQAFECGHTSTSVCTPTSARADAQDGDRAYLQAVGELWRLGFDVDWQRFHAVDHPRRVGLPHYPFEGVWVALTKQDLASPRRTEARSSSGLVAPSITPLGAFHAAAHDTARAPRPADYEQIYVPPEGPIEAQVAEIFGRILGISPVGANDSLFELGGTSIMLVHVANQLRASFEKNVPIRAIVAHITPRDLATLLQREYGLSGT